MKILQNIIGGLAGAIALNAIHETFKRIDPDAPRIDLLGEEALSKSVAGMGFAPPVGKKLFIATLGADIASNSFYYSMIGQGKDKHLLSRGIAYGLVAGIGAVGLPKKMGLDETPVTKTTKTKVLTVAWYLAGAVVTAMSIKALRGK